MKKKIKTKLLRIYWILSEQIGVNPVKMLRFVSGLYRYSRDYFLFKKSFKGDLELVPCLHDWNQEGGDISQSEYFWQDLIVARKIFINQPKKHIDIGSRIDGFVAHVASFMTIELFDIRPVSAKIPGVSFKQLDFMNTEEVIVYRNYADSISCLHALEHFGLGRYNDPINPRGYEKGIENIASILSENGIFYLAVPVGIPRVEFNAQHVFSPEVIVKLCAENNLSIVDFILFTHEHGVIENDSVHKTIELASAIRYGLGIYTFKKVANEH